MASFWVLGKTSALTRQGLTGCMLQTFVKIQIKLEFQSSTCPQGIFFLEVAGVYRLSSNWPQANSLLKGMCANSFCTAPLGTCLANGNRRPSPWPSTASESASNKSSIELLWPAQCLLASSGWISHFSSDAVRPRHARTQHCS